MWKRHRIVTCLTGLLLSTAFIGCAPTQTRQSPGQFIDDATITTKVKAAIFNEPTLKVLQINVETFKGIVQLSGFVDSRESAAKASQVAREVAGVTDVKNDLIVK